MEGVYGSVGGEEGGKNKPMTAHWRRYREKPVGWMQSVRCHQRPSFDPLLRKGRVTFTETISRPGASRMPDHYQTSGPGFFVLCGHFFLLFRDAMADDIAAAWALTTVTPLPLRVNDREEPAGFALVSSVPQPFNIPAVFVFDDVAVRNAVWEALLVNQEWAFRFASYDETVVNLEAAPKTVPFRPSALFRLWRTPPEEQEKEAEGPLDRVQPSWKKTPVERYGRVLRGEKLELFKKHGDKRAAEEALLGGRVQVHHTDVGAKKKVPLYLQEAAGPLCIPPAAPIIQHSDVARHDAWLFALLRADVAYHGERKAVVDAKVAELEKAFSGSPLAAYAVKERQIAIIYPAEGPLPSAPLREAIK